MTAMGGHAQLSANECGTNRVLSAGETEVRKLGSDGAGQGQLLEAEL